ncbi:MAG: hypothetical protein PHD21_06370 [Flavobacteriales bacterium]|nr:hypothetical protein [Flavobacteriales bacterium]
MKKTLLLTLLALCACLSCYTIIAQNKVPAEKVKVKAGKEDIKIKEKEINLGTHRAIMGGWSLLGFISDGIPPKTFMGGEQFPKGTIFTFGPDGKGVTSYNGKRVSNFKWKASGEHLKIEYVVLNATTSATGMERDDYRIMELNAQNLIIGTTFDKMLVGK